MAEKENLSALFDGESIDKALIDTLGNDASLQDDWKSFTLSRDAMRGELSQGVNWNIADNVAAALENEPTYGPAHGFVRADNVLEMTRPKPIVDVKKSSIPSWFQQLSQVGMAAGVALAVIVGVQEYGQGSDPLSSAQPPVLQTIPLSGMAEPVSFSRKSMDNAPNETKIMEQRRRINALFQDYELQLRLNTNEISLNTAPVVSDVSEINR